MASLSDASVIKQLMQRLTSQSTDSSGWLSAGWVTDDQEEEEEVVGWW